jgi:hypothetical protein
MIYIPITLLFIEMIREERNIFCISINAPNEPSIYEYKK